MKIVRDAFFDTLRHHDMTTIFANPGSTEIPLLSDFPDDIEFVLCLHEASVVGAATGWAYFQRVRRTSCWTPKTIRSGVREEPDGNLRGALLTGSEDLDVCAAHINYQYVHNGRSRRENTC